MKFHLLLIVLLTILNSCTPKSGDALIIDEWHEQIMEIHDTVMPELSTIHRLKKRIKKIDVDKVEVDKLILINQLENADESMMSWMAGYRKPKKMESHTIQFLQNQKVAVESVDSIMMTTIKRAEEFLVKYEN